jgi:hypothetical protein
MTAAGTTKVWDLADGSSAHGAHRRGMDLGGPIAATLGVLSLGAAVAPGLPAEARWSLVVGAGVVALLVALSAIRRRQAVLSMLLAFAGLVCPIAAGAVMIDGAMSAKPTVTSAVVPDNAFLAVDDTLVSTPAFATLAPGRRADAEAFATSLVLRLRTLHGTFGPYPTSLQLSNGSVVEGAGGMRGTALGMVPADARLRYDVTASRTTFRVIVLADGNDAASVTASSALAASSR